MPVDSRSAEYEATAPLWRKCRDVIAGQEAVHAAGERYLPRLGGDTQDKYRAYVMRAGFYNATGRTVDGLSGMVFRKPPQIEAPTAMDEMLDDVDMAGQPFQGFAEACVEEILAVSRALVLVDFPQVDDPPVTATQAQNSGLRPFLRLYQAEHVIDWRTGQVNNRTQLVQVRLQEQVMAPVDEFEDEAIDQIRVLDLAEGAYRVRTFRESESKEWELFDETVPRMNGAPLSEIPAIFLSPRDLDPAVVKPVLLDLVDANLSHYRTTADLEHGAHFTALPTPYLFGINEDETPTGIGPTALWSSQNESATAGLIEYTGQGLEALENRRLAKEQHMAALGARMLAPDKRQAEAAETAQIHRQGEMSVLASVSQAVSLGLTRALEIARDWMGVGGDVSVTLNRDFMAQPMSAEMLRELVAAVQGGTISQETLFDNLQRGEIVGKILF